MHRLFQIAIVALLAPMAPAHADHFARIQDPGKFCDDLFRNISPFKSGEIAKKVAATMGESEAFESLGNGMKVLEGKKVDFSKKIIDRDIVNALRQIVYYAYIEDVGFLYFRLNFKVTSTGWVLTNFNFKGETNGLFPKDYIEP